MEDYLKQLKSEFDDIDSNIGWNSLYQTIRSESSTNHDFACSEAKNPSNKFLNRYRDVSPFDHSRVILSKGPCNYINASLVKVSKAGRNYILTQGPLPHTAGHFWLMVWEQRSKAVLMLNKIIEKNQIKCHQYWPVGSKDGGHDVMEFPDVGISVQLLKEEEYKHFIIRTLSVKDTSTDNTREVFQFHYTTWPDFGVPSSPRAFLYFLQAVRDSGALNSKVGPPVVHCSAGIGRSGTFCLVDSCLLMMEEGASVNVKEILLDMRKYRMGLIQTADQLRFSYLAINEGIKQMTEGKKRFMCDEENGDAVEHDEKPLPPIPPTRIDSLTIEDHLKRLIEANEISTRPLPETPCSDDSMSDTSSEEDSISDEIEDEDDEESKEESVSEPKNSSNNVHHTSGSSANVEGSSSKDTPNGVDTANEDNALRRRAKNDALRDKIRDIKAHQKESEAIRGIYRSPKPKRRRGSKDDVGGDLEDFDDENDGDDDDRDKLIAKAN